MTRNAHTVFALGVAASGLVFANMSPAWAIGVVICGNLPDTLEMSYRKGNGYARLIPHRTLTHWWMLWTVVYFALERTVFPAFPPPAIIEDAILGGIAGALAHIVADAFSPTGVPFLWPTVRFRQTIVVLYRTGGAAEWAVATAPLVVVLAVFLIVVTGEHLG